MMLKSIVREVVDSINKNPSAWNPAKGMFKWDGVKRDNIEVTGYGNPKVISVIDLEVNRVRIQLSWFDAYYLEKAVQKWYKTAPMDKF